MPSYRVLFKTSADRSLKRLPQNVQRRIVGDVEMLAHNPRPSVVVKLIGAENLWRIRIGDYRVVYEIHDDRLVILVLRVAHRKDIYRGS
jgi:mRNA interferase RelE/StbE